MILTHLARLRLWTRHKSRRRGTQRGAEEECIDIRTQFGWDALGHSPILLQLIGLSCLLG